MNSNITDKDFMERFELVNAMDTVVKSLNHEMAYEEWIMSGIPDMPDAEDIEEIAGDNERMQEVCDTFRGLIKRYGKDGFCIGSYMF